jgi:hypothetical protein
LFELVHMASAAFPRVALYFENSILQPDLPLLSAAAATVTHYSKETQGTTVTSPADFELVWSGGGATVDGKTWPLITTDAVRLPAGTHVVRTAPRREGITIADLNATLLSASADAKQAAFRYSSSSRAIVRFDRRPANMTLDGRPFAAECVEASDCAVVLPAGEHGVTVR